MKRFNTDTPSPEPAPEREPAPVVEEPYVESVLPKTLAEMWKEYASEFGDDLPDHERYRLKHAFYYAAYSLLVDYDKIPDRHAPESESLENQLELWNEEASKATLDLSREFMRKNKGLPYVEKPKIEGN